MKNIKTLAAALIAVAAAFAVPAQAATEANGISINGMKLNGLKLNGYAWNGLKLNGYAWNGFSLNGTQMQGTQAGEIVAVSLPTEAPQRCEVAAW